MGAPTLTDGRVRVRALAERDLDARLMLHWAFGDLARGPRVDLLISSLLADERHGDRR